jgi:hypothetical protein
MIGDRFWGSIGFWINQIVRMRSIEEMAPPVIIEDYLTITSGNFEMMISLRYFMLEVLAMS